MNEEAGGCGANGPETFWISLFLGVLLNGPTVRPSPLVPFACDLHLPTHRWRTVFTLHLELCRRRWKLAWPAEAWGGGAGPQQTPLLTHLQGGSCADASGCITEVGGCLLHSMTEAQANHSPSRSSKPLRLFEAPLSLQPGSCS